MKTLFRFCFGLVHVLLVVGCQGSSRIAPMVARADHPAGAAPSRVPDPAAPTPYTAQHPLVPSISAPADAGVPLTGPRFTLVPVARGFIDPVFVTHADDGTGRLFVVEKAGRIRTVPGNRSFLDIRHRVRTVDIEQGLLGLAFHPHFRDNRQFYVAYTEPHGGLVVSRFHASPDGQSSDPESENILFWQEEPAGNHNGGMLAFGPDEYLYIGLGDGGGVNDPFGNAQNSQTFLGKLLRIDVDSGDPYGIPVDNPFVHDDGTLSEIWASGLRNPWRFSFDRLTGELYLADVGQNRYEGLYVDSVASSRGANYGWAILEGSHCLADEACAGWNMRRPIIEYDHSQGCAIIGGAVYRGKQLSTLYGRYVFGDYCSGRIWLLDPAGEGRAKMQQVIQANAGISSFGLDETGELYVLDMRGGTLYQLAATSQ